MRFSSSTLTFGIEKEYVVIGNTADKLCNVLIADKIIRCFEKYDFLDSASIAVLDSLKLKGWKIFAQYSNCLIEVASPPYIIGEVEEITFGFEQFSYALNLIANRLLKNVAPGSELTHISVSDQYGSSTLNFCDIFGVLITSSKFILMENYDNTTLKKNLPKSATFGGEKISNNDIALLYASFISVHLTVDLNFSFSKGKIDEKGILQFWHVVHYCMKHQNYHKLQDALFLKNHYSKINKFSPREFFLNFADREGKRMANLCKAALCSEKSEEILIQEFIYQFGGMKLDDTKFRKNMNYLARPRFRDGRLLVEVRMFDGSFSSLEIARLASRLTQII